jgi:CheY-like chemotaxis protein
MVEASNGKIAVEKYQESLDKPCNCPCKGFKLVLMDIQMPVMGGIEATEKILRLRPTNVVALTSYTGEKVKKECHDVGMKDVYLKPCFAIMIKEIIQKYYN